MATIEVYKANEFWTSITITDSQWHDIGYIDYVEVDQYAAIENLHRYSHPHAINEIVQPKINAYITNAILSN